MTQEFLTKRDILVAVSSAAAGALAVVGMQRAIASREHRLEYLGLDWSHDPIKTHVTGVKFEGDKSKNVEDAMETWQSIGVICVRAALIDERRWPTNIPGIAFRDKRGSWNIGTLLDDRHFLKKDIDGEDSYLAAVRIGPEDTEFTFGMLERKNSQLTVLQTQYFARTTKQDMARDPFLREIPIS